MPIACRARAKVNLVLRVRGRLANGFHDLESLVAFAGAGDHLSFDPGGAWSLSVEGPEATLIVGDNLVLRAAAAMQARWPNIRRGHFTLRKHLPVSSGIGGGSADAAAAIRLIARASGIADDDPGLVEVAGEVGSDVPVCVASAARIFRGRGDVLDAPLDLPPLACVLVNPRVAVSTAKVFAALGLRPGEVRQTKVGDGAPPGASTGELIDWLADEPNDLEAPAIAICPPIAEVLTQVRAQASCRLARMSGSGATVFGLFDDCRTAAAAARAIARGNPGWWIRPTILR